MTESQAQKDTGRLEAFSDGVFAIAITLLVLELRVPSIEGHTSTAELMEALLHQWPSYVAYLFSFATILIMWVSHHQLLRLIRRSTTTFMYINGLLLLLITTVPFPTALLAEYLRYPGSTLACAIYTGLFVAIAIAFNLLWAYASRGGLVGATIKRGLIGSINHSYYLGPLLYLLAFGLSFVNVYLSIALCGAMALYYAVLSYEEKAAKAPV